MQSHQGSQNSSPFSQADTFRSDNSRTLNIVQHSLRQETERSKANLQSLKHQVNEFLNLLQVRISSEPSESASQTKNNLSVIYQKSDSANFRTPKNPSMRQDQPEIQSPIPKVQHQQQFIGGLEQILSHLQRYSEIPVINLVIKQLELDYSVWKRQVVQLRQRNKQLLEINQRLKCDNEMHMESLSMVRTHWQSLLKNHEQVVNENFQLAERMDDLLSSRQKSSQLQKDIEYYRYLIVAANQKYEQIKEQSLQKSAIIKSLVNKQNYRQESQSRSDKFRDLIAKLKDSSQLSQLLEGFLEEDKMSKSILLATQVNVLKAATPGEKMKEPKRQRAKEDLSIEESYRKMLFK